MGGLLKFWAVESCNVAAIKSDEIIISSLDDVYEIYCTPGTISFTENEEENTTVGNFYKSELQAFSPKDSQAAYDVFTEMKNRRFVVIYLDENEQFKLVGTKYYPLRFTTSLQTGQDTPDRNGHSLSFKGVYCNKAIFIRDPFT